MKPFALWVLLDSKGRPWRYTDGSVVTYGLRSIAKEEASGLDPKRGWRPVRARVTVSGESR